MARLVPLTPLGYKLERWHRLTEKQKASFAPICPDFVIELRSASDRVSSLQKKMEEYITNGAVLGWAVWRGAMPLV